METFNKWLESNTNPLPQMSDDEHDAMWEQRLQQVGQTVTNLKGVLQILQQDQYDDTGYRDETIQAVQNCMRVLGRWHQVAMNGMKGVTG